MATSTPTATEAPAPPRARRRILPRLVLALLLLLVGAIGYLYYMAH
jgi:hypothetical protein